MLYLNFGEIGRRLSVRLRMIAAASQQGLEQAMEKTETGTTLMGVWNEASEDARQRIVSKTLADNFTYADPSQPDILAGKRAFLDYLSLARRRMNGVKIRLDGDVQTHHGHARFRTIQQENGETVGKGTYFADFTENGRIWRLVNFKD